MAIATRITLDEFMQMEEEKPSLEYACGEVTQKPMPGRSHAAIQGFLQMLLGQFLYKPALVASSRVPLHLRPRWTGASVRCPIWSTSQGRT